MGKSVNNFIFAFKGMANFEIETFNLFFSKIINAKMSLGILYQSGY